MKWANERDALIAQTLAFVQSVTGGRNDAAAPHVDHANNSAEPAPTGPAPGEPAKAVRLPKGLSGALPAAGEMQNEIRARIASFRAHQERFNREREEYFRATISRLREAMKDIPPPQAEK